MRWEKVALRELIKIKNGKDHKKLKDGNYPVYGSGGVIRYVDSYLYDKESVLLPRKGTLNNIQIATEPFWTVDTCYYTEVNINKVIPYFLYSSLKRFDIQALNTGAAVPSMTFDKYYGIKIELPDLKTQKRIASILSAYDDLIETNRKQIKLLKEAAQRLYKEWFVDFRFPGHENIQIVDGVPEGWRVCKIKDLCKRIQSGSTPARKNKEYWDNPEIAWFKTAELQDSWLLDSEEKITQVALDNTSVKLFPKNTVLMAIYASPTLGRLGILDCEATFNQAALGLVAKEGFITTEWLFLKLYELRDEFNSIARGAGQQNISGDIVKNYEVLTPNVEQIQQFTNLVQPFFAKVKVLRIENAKLIEARDRLLPKLMSGEIEV